LCVKSSHVCDLIAVRHLQLTICYLVRGFV